MTQIIANHIVVENAYNFKILISKRQPFIKL